MKNPIFKPSISNEDTLDEMISAIMTDNKISHSTNSQFSIDIARAAARDQETRVIKLLEKISK